MDQKKVRAIVDALKKLYPDGIRSEERRVGKECL